MRSANGLVGMLPGYIRVSGFTVASRRGRAVVLLLWLVILSMVVSIIQFILLPIVRIFDPKLHSYHRCVLA